MVTTLTTTRLVVKRDRSVQEFDALRIYNAIYGAFRDVNKDVDIEAVNKVADYVREILLGIPDEQVDIERIQKLIQAALMHNGHFDEAEAFILYRKERANVRKQKQEILEKDFLTDVEKSFTFNQLAVLSKRYLLRDLATKKLVESPEDLFKRVATLMGLSDLLHDPLLFDKEGGHPITCVIPSYEQYSGILQSMYINEHHYERFVNLYCQLNDRGQMKRTLYEILDTDIVYLYSNIYQAKIKEYENLMINCEFMPNTPTLMNSGTSIGGLSACFVLHAPDSADGYIRGTVGDACAVYKVAGGVGIDYTEFRPEGSSANGVPNAASGPVSFMEMIDTLTDVIKAGGKRRGANMGILQVHHPDIEKFITMKQKAGVLENFNVSVGINDDYWDALTSGKTEYQLYHKTHDEMNRIVNPQQLWDLIAVSAWKSAEPGVIFFDNINRVNHMLTTQGPLKATNPCGEQPLYPNSSCTLGSINVSKCVDEAGNFDWGQFKELVKICTRFLDNVVSMNKYPTKAIEEMALKERRIGLGVMGVADALYKMKIAYNSAEGFGFIKFISQVLTSTSIEESLELSKERGPAPLFDFETQGKGIINKRTVGSLSFSQPWGYIEDHIRRYGLRNTWNTTVAPTGTIAMIAKCSYGIEPEYALVFEKEVTIGKFYYANEIFAKALKEEGLYTEEILAKIADNGGSIQNIPEIPDWMKKVFVVSMDIHWADHVMAQGICQQYIDNAISKTINLSKEVMVEDIKNAYLLAHEVKCKGITVYRDGSRAEQVLHTTSAKTGTQLKPSQFTLDYIKNNIKNEYARNILCKFFGIVELPHINEGPIEFHIAPPDYESYKEAVKFIEQSKDKSKCETCNSSLIFAEGCKLCPNCQVSYCNV
jgi:ribonucleoside-diphosphate reductase alpha chain